MGDGKDNNTVRHDEKEHGEGEAREEETPYLATLAYERPSLRRFCDRHGRQRKLREQSRAEAGLLLFAPDRKLCTGIRVEANLHGRSA